MTQRIARLPAHRTLRMEASLRREAIKKEFGSENSTKYYLEQGSKRAEKIVHHFWKSYCSITEVIFPTM